MAQEQIMDRSQIQGWGADLEMSKRPAVPKERTPPRFINPHWDQPEQQPVRMKIYKSIERPSLTPVFGTSSPPRGLSGKIRDIAYSQFSENKIQHWLLLLFADRINVVEGIVEDFGRGHVPNILAEMGIKSEFKYNTKNAIKKTLLVAGAIGVFAYWMKNRNRNSFQTYDADM